MDRRLKGCLPQPENGVGTADTIAVVGPFHARQGVEMRVFPKFAALPSVNDLFSMRGNNTRQGYARERTLKPAGYFFLAFENPIRPVLKGLA